MVARAALRREWIRSRQRTDELFRRVAPEALYARPIPERHRLIFYLGHLEAFDWNQMACGALGEPSFHPEFDQLFEFGIDPPVGQAPQDQPSDWPAVDAVEAYNAEVRKRLEALLDRVPAERVHVAIEHRDMHAETFAYLLQNLAPDQKIAPAEAAEVSGAAEPPANPLTLVPAGAVTLGRRRGDGFGWDNEFEAMRVNVPAFAMQRYKVTNGEYLRFVADGAAPPHFWRGEPGKWRLQALYGEIDLPLDWPVYVTQREAAAFARWRGLELPTEAQFQRAAYGCADGVTETDPDPARGNFDFRSADPVPVSADPGVNSFGLAQMVGNGWEWTSTVFGPLPGFEPFPFYPGYSAAFFDGRHYVLKGASAHTAARLTRRSFRNWFRPDYPYVFAGFRCVENR